MNTSEQTLKEKVNANIELRINEIGYVPKWVILIIDTCLCGVAYLLSYLLGHQLFEDASDHLLNFWQQGIILLFIQVIYFRLFHTYLGIIRYSTFVDTIRCLAATFGTTLLYLVLNYLCYAIINKCPFETIISIIYAFIAFVAMFAFRVSIKTLFEMVKGERSPRVLVYGIQEAGIAITKMLRSAGNTPFRPIAFICDANEEHSHELLGLPIKVLNDDLFHYMKLQHVEDVIISPIKMKSINPGADLSVFLSHGIKVHSTPSFTDWEDVDKASEAELSSRIGRINDIKVEDLLERPSIMIDTENVTNIIRHKIVMVTGAAGSIGSELVRQVAKYEPKAIVLLEQAESPLHDLILDLRHKNNVITFIPIIADVRNRERLEQVFNDYHPEVIFHAAAYKHVPLMEMFPNEAIRANVMGTKNMADMAVKYGVKQFVMISTDKAVNPTNVMGCSKRIAEIYVQSLFKKIRVEKPSCTKFITTRFGNVLGSNGSVIPYFKKQIADGGPVTVTHPNIIRYFMTIPEACTLVMEAATLGNGGEIFVFDMGHPVKIYDLACNMIHLAGMTPGKDIEIVFTGLRPGEKLFEELLNNKEETLPTKNEKIMVAKVREMDYDVVSPQIDELIDIAHQDKVFSTVKQMKHIVPEFISKNSEFEMLDK